MPFRVKENSTSCLCKHETVVPKPEGRKTRRAEARWQRLGADPEDFQAFVNLFARRRSPYIRQAWGSGWTTVNHKLSDDLIVQHLLGDKLAGKRPIWIGTRSFEATKFVAIDVDCRGDSADFVQRCNQCEHVLYSLGIPREDWLVRRSPSGGRHYFIFFRELVFADQLPGLFELAGLRLASGKFEIYPSENQGFRVPFGYDPIGDSSLSWRDFIRKYRSGRIRRVSWSAMWRRAESLAQRRTACRSMHMETPQIRKAPLQAKLGLPQRFRMTNKAATATKQVAEASNPRQETFVNRPNKLAPDISEIWAAGITEVGTRVSVTKLLAWHLVFAKRLPESEVLALLVPWIYETGKGTSKTVSADLQIGTRHAEKQTREIVRWYVQRRTERPHTTGLRFTQSEIETYVRATEALPTSEKYRHFRFALDFCKFAKSTGKLDDRGWVCLPSVEGIIKKWNDCSSGNSYKPRLDWAIASGLAVLVREKAQSHRRPRTFAFAAIAAQTGERSFSFDEALDYGLQLIASRPAPQASSGRQHSDDYQIVSPRGRVKALQATEPSKVELWKGRNWQSSVNRVDRSTPCVEISRLSSRADQSTDPKPANPVPGPLGPGTLATPQLCDQDATGPRTDLDPSTAEWPGGRPTIQSQCDQMIGQAQFHADEAAVLDRLSGRSSRCDQSPQRTVRDLVARSPQLPRYGHDAARLRHRLARLARLGISTGTAVRPPPD